MKGRGGYVPAYYCGSSLLMVSPIGSPARGVVQKALYPPSLIYYLNIADIVSICTLERPIRCIMLCDTIPTTVNPKICHSDNAALCHLTDFKHWSKWDKGANLEQEVEHTTTGLKVLCSSG